MEIQLKNYKVYELIHYKIISSTDLGGSSNYSKELINF